MSEEMVPMKVPRFLAEKLDKIARKKGRPGKAPWADEGRYLLERGAEVEAKAVGLGGC